MHRYSPTLFASVFAFIAATPLANGQTCPVSGVSLTFDSVSVPSDQCADATSYLAGSGIMLKTSPTWSGYAVIGKPGSVTGAAGSWTVPAVICSGTGDTYSGFWVGIDGIKIPEEPQTIEQIGTSSNCKGGSPEYAAWYEIIQANVKPQPPVPIKNLIIQPGDPISADVSYSTVTGQFTLTLTDLALPNMPGVNPFSTSATVAGAQKYSAECIAEAPVGENMTVLPLANFGTALYGQDNTGVSNTCAATVGSGSSEPLGQFQNPIAISMVTDGTVLASPSPLSDESSFSVNTPFLLFFDGFTLPAGAVGNGWSTWGNGADIINYPLPCATLNPPCGQLETFGAPEVAGGVTRTLSVTFPVA